MRYERQLRISQSLGGCPVHLRKLVCVRCEARRAKARWLGTPAELDELRALFSRGQPYRDQIPAASVCPREGCGGRRYCEPCYDTAWARVRVPEDLYMPTERMRLDELLGLLCVTAGPRP